MRIVLYTCTAENNRVNKEEYLSNSFQLEGVLRGKSSVIDPIIQIEKTNPAYYNYNYMYIADFRRFYYINNITHIQAKIWEISAHVDVLYTWYRDIIASPCIIERSSTYEDANLYLDDGSFVMDSRKYNTVKSFPYGFNDNGEYVLICAGGVNPNAG